MNLLERIFPTDIIEYCIEPFICDTEYWFLRYITSNFDKVDTLIRYWPHNRYRTRSSYYTINKKEYHILSRLVESMGEEILDKCFCDLDSRSYCLIPEYYSILDITNIDGDISSVLAQIVEICFGISEFKCAEAFIRLARDEYINVNLDETWYDCIEILEKRQYPKKLIDRMRMK